MAQNPRKPEPSMLTKGRAKAKGTTEAYVSPRLSPVYVREKREASEPQPPVRQPTDDTAAGYANHGAHTDRINAALRKAGHL